MNEKVTEMKRGGWAATPLQILRGPSKMFRGRPFMQPTFKSSLLDSQSLSMERNANWLCLPNMNVLLF